MQKKRSKKRINKSKLIRFVVFLALSLIILISIFKGLFNKKEKIFTIMDIEDYHVQDKGEASILFDELVLDIDYEDEKNFSLNNSKARNGQIISSLDETMLRGLRALSEKEIKSTNLPSKKNNEIVDLLEKGLIGKLNLYHKYDQAQIDYAKNAIKENKLTMFESSYVKLETDGYESLLNVNHLLDSKKLKNKKDLDLNSLVRGKKISDAEKDTGEAFNDIHLYGGKSNSFKGLKFVNNRSFYISIKIDKADKYLDKKGRDFDIEIDDKTIKGKLIQIQTNKYGKDSILWFNVTNNFEDFENKRFAKASIHRENFQAVKLPREAIINKKGKRGIFIADKRGSINFIEVDILSEDKDKVYIKLIGDNNKYEIKLYDDIVIDEKLAKED